MYPTPLEKVGLNIIQTFRDRFHCPVGLSDHSGSIYPPLAAIALGTHLIEVHVTFHRKAFGPDVSSSLTFEELRILTEGAKAFHKLGMNPVDKNQTAAELRHIRETFSKSLALSYEVPEGTILQKEMLTLKKPGTGIAPDEVEKVVGRRLRKRLGPEALLRWEDLE